MNLAEKSMFQIQPNFKSTYNLKAFAQATYGTAQNNLTPASGQQFQHPRVILMPLVIGMRVPVGNIPVSSKACL